MTKTQAGRTRPVPLLTAREQRWLANQPDEPFLQLLSRMLRKHGQELSAVEFNALMRAWEKIEFLGWIPDRDAELIVPFLIWVAVEAERAALNQWRPRGRP